MDFIVEDGTDVSGANAYVTVEYADAYFANRGYTAWEEYTQVEKQQRIVIATQYIDTRWYGQFKGEEFYDDQSLQFPRDFWTVKVTDPVTEEESEVPVMPVQLLMACCEYARAVNGETMSLTVDFETSETGGAIKRKKEQVGTLQTDTEYFSSGTEKGSVWATYTMADNLMNALLRQSVVWRCIRN